MNAVPPPGAPPVMVETAPPAPAPIMTPPVVSPVVPVAAAAPAPASVLKQELLVDSYYMYNLSGGNSMIPPSLRNYDLQSNSFTLNYAKFAFQVDSEFVTVRADLGYGQLASLISGGTIGTSAFAAQQAYASLRIPGVTQLSIDFGRFNTTAGAEVIEANRNWLYSRSLLFFIIPVTHTGVRLNYKVSDMLSLQASLVNGIFNDQPDNNSDKTFGGSVAITPASTTSIIATAYLGREAAEGSDPNPYRFTGDLVIAHNFSDKLGVNFNYDYVKVGDTYVTGGSLMGRLGLAEHLNLAARGELLLDHGFLFAPVPGMDISNTTVYEGTLMLGVPFGGHFEARAEFRGDFASEAVFITDVDAMGDASEFEDKQFTGTIAVMGFI